MEPASPALEAIWRDLRPHLEWAQGFALVFLFAGHPQPVAFLRDRLAESLQPRTLRLTVIAPRTADEVPAAVEQILAARPDPGHGPLWVELWRGAESEGWPRARRQALQRLNERRFLLEYDVARPMILILPREVRGRVYVEAPDLWAVRSFTAELPAPIETGRVKALTLFRDDPALLSSAPGPAELEWARLLQRTADPAALDLRDGLAAFETAIERGDLTAARAIANQTLHIARHQFAAVGGPSEAGNEASRNLAIALDNVGEVERDLGNLEAARALYRESLDLRRRLREVAGDTPQALRDLSISLERAGDVEHDLGNLEAARAAYRESLDLRRRVRETVGDTPQALRDLSVSLERVGDIERALGNLEAARALYRESLPGSATLPTRSDMDRGAGDGAGRAHLTAARRKVRH
jgi:tetratricopeptide (TPR) repeat protein